jgi:hypothetical protein
VKLPVADSTSLLRSTSSSPDLLGLITNSATVFSDLRRTVFLALESTLRVP